MATQGPAPVDTGTTTSAVVRPVDRVPVPVPPGPGTTGQIPAVKTPQGPPEAAPPAVTPSPGIAVPPVTAPQGPPENMPPAVPPGPATGQSAGANTVPIVPVQELPVDTPNVDTGGNNVIPPAINYIQVLANGVIVVQNTTAMNFTGSGFTVTGNGSVATITVLGSSYGDSNVVTLLSSFGSNVLSTTGNITGSYILGNGSQLTGLPATYGNANVVANLAALGSNPVSTTGNVTAGYVKGNGSQLTGIVSSYGNANVVANLAALGSNPVSTTGNVTSNYVFGNGSQLTGLPATYGNANVVANLAALGTNPISTTGNITTTANVSGNYILGNGSQLTGIAASYGNANVATFLAAYGSNTISTTGNITAGNLIGNISITGNVTGTSANVTLVAGSYSYTFDNTGNLTLPANGDIIMSGTNSILSAGGTTLLGGYSQVGGSYSTLGVKYPGAGTQFGMTLQPTNDNTTAIQFLNAAGNSIGNIKQTSSTVQFVGDGSQLSNVATQTTGSWTLAPGTNTVSLSVPINGTYSIWVRGSIPSGIVTYTATVVVTNTNVPVLGTSYGWYYVDGNQLVLTAIPAQVVGTLNNISTATVSTTTANVFTFGITNNSGTSQIVSYGWTKLG
jgi:hypothetical protein